MKYGIPFTRPFTSPFGAPFFGLEGGGGSPSEPTGFVAKYTAYLVDNFTLVTGDSVNVWQDESVNSNDLTQGTSANQPKLVEDNTVTQFTASNQPTFAKDKQVAQDTLASMPTYDETEDALAFDGDRMGGLTPQIGNFTYELELDLSNTSTTILQQNVVGGARLYGNGSGQMFLVSDTASNASFGLIDWIPNTTLKLIKDGGNVSLYQDGSLILTQDRTGETFSFTGIAEQNGFIGNIRSLKQWNSAVSTGTPDFELDASDPSTMLNDSSEEPQDGDSVRLWHDPSAVDVMAFGNSQYLNKLPLSDSFTLEITDIKWTNTGGGILSSEITSCRLTRSTNTYNLVTDLGNIFNLGSYIHADGSSLKLVKDGNSVELFEDGIKQNTVDLTGETLSLSRLSRASGSFQGTISSINYWNSADSSGEPDFTLTPDPTTMTSDSFTTPTYGEGVRLWHDPSAVDVVAFGSNDFLNLYEETPNGNVTFLFENVINTKLNGTMSLLRNNTNGARIYMFSDDALYLYDTGVNIGWTGLSTFQGDIKITINGDLANLNINGVDYGNKDISSLAERTYDTLSSSSFSDWGSLGGFKQWNSADDSGDPDFTLTADPTKLRTSANANPVLGEDVAKWYADEFSAYRDSRVVFDTNDNMSGLPALTGDWSYMIDTSINTLGTTKYLLEQTAGSSAILALADNLMYLRDTTGANDIALTSYTLTTGRTQFGFVRSGDDLLYYVNGVLKETVDVTGRTFDFGTVGKSATSSDMDTKQIIPFDRALTQTEIGYYSYLRSETGEILLPPLLPS